MKVILKLAVHGIAAIAALASCSKEQKEQPVSSQLGMKAGFLGTWKQIYENDEYCPTNLCSVKTFFADGTETVSNSKYSESKGGWMWQNKEPYNFTIVGDQIHENSTVSSAAFTTTVVEMKISADEDNEYNVHGDWFATRWRPEAGADFNYECWDIDYMKHREVIKIILNFLSKTLNQTCTK